MVDVSSFNVKLVTAERFQIVPVPVNVHIPIPIDIVLIFELELVNLVVVILKSFASKCPLFTVRPLTVNSISSCSVNLPPGASNVIAPGIDLPADVRR